MMRYLKIASDRSPSSDYIELNDFNGYLCTSFQQIGISRDLEFLPIKNRNVVVGNKIKFKTYSLTIEILTKYKEYDRFYTDLIRFLDRNKDGGIRLYYGLDENSVRYCLCSIQSSAKTEKMQPIILVVTQNSLWMAPEKHHTTTAVEQSGNMFIFSDDGGYYSAKFADDNGYFSVEFFNGFETTENFENEGYNEVPLRIRIRGSCINPRVTIYKNGSVYRKIEVYAEVDDGSFIEIDANVLTSGVWYVTDNRKVDYSSKINYENGSPFVFIENGNYSISVEDAGGNSCITDVFYNEEYSE